MTLAKRTLDYYRELCDVEKHYSWKNTTIAVPMSSLQELINEIDRLTNSLADARACNEQLVEKVEQIQEMADHGKTTSVQ